MGKGNKQVKSGEQTVINSLPDYARPYFENLMERAEGESLQGYQPYQGQRIAESGSIADIVNSRDMARNVANQGMPETQEAIGGIRDLSRQGQFTGQMAQDYMNPYMEQVVDRQKQGAIQDFNRMGASRNAQAVNAGAFGGSRQGVTDYLAQEGLQQQLGDIDASGREAAFRDARSGFDADRQAGMSGLGQLAQLGSARRAGDIQGAQLLEGIGKQQLGEQQAGMDIGYQDFMNQQNFNKDQLGFFSNMLQGVPVRPNTSQQNFQPYNPMQQALGAGVAGLSLYRGLT
jgi:hypothetical protein